MSTALVVVSTDNVGVNVRQLDTRIRGVGTRMASIKEDVQEIALDIARVCYANGGAQLDRFTRLNTNLGTKGLREQFERWVGSFFPVKWKDGVASLVKARIKEHGDNAWNFEQAIESPWFNALTDGQQKARELDLDAILKMLDGIKDRVTKAEKGEGNFVITDNRVFKAVDMIKAYRTEIGNIVA